MKNIVISIIIMLSLLSSVACRQRTSEPVAESGSYSAVLAPQKVRKFIPAIAPSTLSPEQQQAYMVEHYWDKFDFADTTFIAEVDTSHMATAFAIYAAGYLPDSLAEQGMTRLMQRASVSRRMFDYFMMLADAVLYNPNSPLRNYEKYIPVLRVAATTPLYDEYERMPYEHDLKMALQNRVGEQANDFVYTLGDGSTGKMSDIEAEYLLLFISNPGCPMCRDIREQIIASPHMNELLERGTLKVLVIYPDEDLAAWREHLADYPALWINAYDKGMVLTREELYDLRAIPSLYLLDKNKKVMAKDCVDVEYIEHLILEADAL